MQYHVLDTETIGLNPPPEPASGVVQVAWSEIHPISLDVIYSHQHLVNPQAPIHPEASKVHGWYERDVIDKPPLEEVYCSTQPTVLICHNCVTEDHEVLTKDGWIPFSAIKGSNVEAAVWSEGVVTFEECPLVVQDYSGPMFAWNTEFHTGIYTPNHELVFTRTGSLLGGGAPKWKKATASEYAKFGPNSVAIPSAGEYLENGTLQMTELEGRIMEMIRADAHIAQKLPVSVRFRFKKDRKISRALSLLTEAEMPYTVKVESDGVTSISVLKCATRDKVVALLGKGKAKKYGPWLLDLPYLTRKAVLNETSFWDGSHAVGANRQTSLSSIVKDDLDWLQILSILSGKGARVFPMAPQFRGYSTGTAIGRVNLRTRAYVKTVQKPQEIQHTGRVYCLNTTTGAFLVRHKGVAWVTGNCSFDVKFVGRYIQNLAGTLCTLSLARHYVRDSKNHKLATLAEHFGLDTGKAHDAGGDVHTTVQLLRKLVEISGKTLPELVAANKVRTFHVMPFGMHKGKRFSALPAKYLEWFLEQEIDEDLRHSITQELRTR